jgi:FHA domain
MELVAADIHRLFVWLIDVSDSGTLINGDKLSPQSPVLLRRGDKITLCTARDVRDTAPTFRVTSLFGPRLPEKSHIKDKASKPRVHCSKSCTNRGLPWTTGGAMVANVA